MKLISLGLAGAFFIGGLNFLNPFGGIIFQFGNFGLAFYCSFLTYFIFKNQILGIEIAYRKGLFYSSLIGSLTGIYLLIIMLIEWLFRGLIGYKSLILSFVAAFIIAIIFNPLRNKIQILIDHLFLGKTPHEIADENERLRQELEKSERLKIASTLALGLAHEVKNPLTTLKTFTEFLPEHYEDKEFLKKFARIVPGEIERVNDIIKQLLQFSKPASPCFQKISIYQLIQNTIALLNSEFLKRRITLNEFYEDKNIEIKADPSQIKQALLNILLNAIDAMPNGGNISIKTHLANGRFAEIEISDQGCGIAKENLKHIFDPFYSKKDNGTGLGLSITYQIIKNHNGLIEAESTLNKGTTFKIKLPLQ